MTRLRDRLIGIERKHGIVSTPNKVRSPLDPRGNTPQMIVGGDRMGFHEYADVYARYIEPFIDTNPVILEVGVFQGNGLVMWRELFPDSRIIGLDIDLSNMNWDLFKDKKQPELYYFDQFIYNPLLISGIIGEDIVDIVIDDGCHQDEAIITTYQALYPHLSKQGVYIIEDNETAWADKPYREQVGRITVI